MKKRVHLLCLCLMISLSPNAQDVGINVLYPLGKFHIKGSSNQSHLIVEANETQDNTNPLLRLTNSNGADLLWIHSDYARNIFIGKSAGRVNSLSESGGNENIFIGSEAGYSNIAGYTNSFIGSRAGYNNISGVANHVVGYSAMYSNQSGFSNSVFGESALYLNDSGGNVACGADAMRYSTNAESCVAIGYKAGYQYSLSGDAVFLGAEADVNFTDGQYMEAIGNLATCTGNDQVRIGNFATVSIGGYADWTNLSDGRFKKSISEEVVGLEFISHLQPVTYNLDVRALSGYLREARAHELNKYVQLAIQDKIQIIQSGFLAQDVETTAHAVGYNFNGIDRPQNETDLYGLRYSLFVVPLVKAVQELSEEVIRLENENARLNQIENEMQSLLQKVLTSIQNQKEK